MARVRKENGALKCHNGNYNKEFMYWYSYFTNAHLTFRNALFARQTIVPFQVGTISVDIFD